MRILKLFFGKRAIFLVAPFLFISCEKDNGEIGLNQVIDGLSGLGDTSLIVNSYTREVDSILVALEYNTQVALGGYGGNRLAGSRIDQTFGRSEAGIVSQMILTQLNPDFGDNPIVDSVKLLLRYSGSYGDTSKMMSMEVYELMETLDRDTSFYSNFNPLKGAKLGEKIDFTPFPNSKTTVDDVETLPVLEIDLDKDYFQEKFADVANGSFTSFSNNEEFLEYFKGIYVSPASEDGSMLYFNLLSSSSRLVIYYNNDDEESTLIMNFAQDKATLPINFSIFSQDYTNYPVGFDLTGTGPSVSTYVQGMGGVSTIIELSELDNFIKQEGILISRAFIEMPTQKGILTSLSPSRVLEVRKMTDEGPGTLIKDFTFAAQSSGDGILREGKLRDNKYIFEITQHIFEVLNGDGNPDLAIVPLNKATTANQTILKGGADPLEEVKLILYYTKP